MPEPHRLREPSPVELIRVGSGRRRVGPPIVVVVALVVVGAALWKPWSQPDAERSTASGAPSIALGSTSSSRPSSATNRRPPGADTPASRSRPSSFGLNLAYMGTTVGRASWGVAAAYVPLTQIVRADAIDRAWVTPVVTWHSLEPDGRKQGPILDRSQSATVALAVTWPAGLDPKTVRLEYVPRPAPNPLLARQVAPRLIPLDGALVAMVSPIPLEWQTIGGAASPDWERRSGTFFLPPESIPTEPADWLTAAWPPGEYAFRIELADGRLARLPFILAG
jgi:hypothetical protein